MALRDAGYETVMVNCNPETVSTDYDTSDRLYFEPLTAEDVVERHRRRARRRTDAPERTAPLVGVIVSLGGQTPLKLAHAIDPGLVLGTPPASIDRPRIASSGTLSANVSASANHRGHSAERSTRPSPVAAESATRCLSGRAMCSEAGRWRSSTTTSDLAQATGLARRRRSRARAASRPTRPVLVDRFLEDAVEVDVDAVRDGAGEVLIAGVMEHVEEAGVHSGDSACALPPQTLGAEVLAALEAHTHAIAESLAVVGPLNVQFAVREGIVLRDRGQSAGEPDGPFVAKATGVPACQGGRSGDARGDARPAA